MLCSLAAGKPVRHWFAVGTTIEVVALAAIGTNRKQHPATPVGMAGSAATAAGLLGGVLIAALLDPARPRDANRIARSSSL
ncbi:hypothetical protein [Nocardia sp. NPDC057455]|uniref:hypothetical protein n=1 Tax=Nocardia sp. NPDC057455 TaxID=3346138 RepID=UPI00366FD56D